MSITCLEISRLNPDIFGEIHGNPNIKITDIAPAEDGKPDSLLFVANLKLLDVALKSDAAAIVLTPDLFKKALEQKTQKTLLVAKNVQMAWALSTQAFFPLRLPHKTGSIHPTATVGKNCVISNSAKIDAHVIIGDQVTVGDCVWIGANSVIENNVTVGNHSHIQPLVFIGSGCIIGNQCEVKPNSTIGSEGFGFATDEKGRHHRIPQRGIVVLEDRVSIGANCTIDRATFKETRIKEGTKIDNMVHVGHNCKIGRNGLFVSGIVFAGSTEVGDHNVYGGHSSISGHIKIADHVHLGGRAGVLSNIDKPGAYGGYPLQPLREHFKTQASLAHLPKIRKKIARIMKHLGLKDEESE
jgi:UDP-3-O-[3-hydroxymyristoyl] glucosamine N-acyltransferase